MQYGQCAGGTRPTGMHSCFQTFLSSTITNSSMTFQSSPIDFKIDFEKHPIFLLRKPYIFKNYLMGSSFFFSFHDS